MHRMSVRYRTNTHFDVFQEFYSREWKGTTSRENANKVGAVNAILARLSPSDFSLLVPHLEPVRLKFRRRLEAANRRTRNVYFIEGGLASAIAVNLADHRQAEVCVIVIVNALEARGLISLARRRITGRDREGLEEAAGDF